MSKFVNTIIGTACEIESLIKSLWWSSLFAAIVHVSFVLGVAGIVLAVAIPFMAKSEVESLKPELTEEFQVLDATFVRCVHKRTGQVCQVELYEGTIFRTIATQGDPDEPVLPGAVHNSSGMALLHKR